MDPWVSREYSTCAVSNLKDLHWDGDASEPKWNMAARSFPRTRSRRRGPPCLMHMAVKVAAENMESFDLQYFDSIPPRLIMLLHEELGSLPGSISLHAWKVYNMAGQKQDLDNKPGKAVDSSSIVSRRFYHHIPLPTADTFTTYIKPLQSTSSFDFISHVRIAGSCQINTEELLLLPSLKNLGVLEIIAPAYELDAFPEVSDRIVRSWSEERGAFPRLVILKIHARYHLSERSLKYLSAFPALAVFEVSGRSREWQQSERLAAEAGWMHCNQAWVTGLPYPSRHHRDTSQSSCEHATEQLSCSDRFRGVDPGCWACWAHTVIRTEPLKLSEDAREARSSWASDGCRPEVPFASLTLGSDSQTLESSRSALLGMSLIFFWRRSLFDEVSPPQAQVDNHASRHSELSQENACFHEVAGSVAKNARKAAVEQQISGRRSKRRRQVGSIGDILNSFQS